MGKETRPAIMRFFSHVEAIKNGCWNWVGAMKFNGYGNFSIRKNKVRKSYSAHRWAYINLVGDIPQGLAVDHLCRNRKCVNPSHMELVTLKENLLRGIGFSGENARKTHCKKGHPLVAVPLSRKTSAQRHCPICEREEAGLWNKNNRERKNENNRRWKAKRADRLNPNRKKRRSLRQNPPKGPRVPKVKVTD